MLDEITGKRFRTLLFQSGIAIRILGLNLDAKY